MSLWETFIVCVIAIALSVSATFYFTRPQTCTETRTATSSQTGAEDNRTVSVSDIVERECR